MSDDSYKDKWCPFVRLAASDNEWNTTRGTRLCSATADNAFKCIGPKCMAWRTNYVHTGYCGLAGKP